MGLALKQIKTEMKGTGGGRWEKRASAKSRANKARRKQDKKEARS